MALKLSASVFRLPCNQASRDNTGDLLRGTGQPLIFWKASSATVQGAAFSGDPTVAGNLVTDWSNIVSVVLAMRIGSATGLLLFPEQVLPVESVNTGLAFTDWTAGTAQHFVFALTPDMLNVAAQQNVWLVIGVNTTDAGAFPIAFSNNVKVSDPGINAPGDENTPSAYTGWSKAEADARYAAANDPGIQLGRSYGITLSGVDLTGATDATANINSAIAALAAGGRIVKPFGTLTCAGIINVNKQIIWQDAGAGPAAQDPTFGNAVVFTSPTANGFNVTATGCRFYDGNFVNTAATPTAGDILHFAASTGMDTSRCNFSGGWQHLNIVDGYAWAINGCFFQSPRNHAVLVADASNADNGDACLSHCTFGSGGTSVPGAAAVRFFSGGGLKINGIKINGALYGAGSFTYGVLAQLDGANTTILLLTGSSIENVSGAGIQVGIVNAGGSFGKVVVVGNEFGYIAGNAGYFGYGPNWKITDLLLGDNNVTECQAGGFIVDRVVGGAITPNCFNGATPHGVVLTANATVDVHPQSRFGGGFLIENAGNSPVHYQHRSQQVVGYPSPAVLYRLAVPAYSGGRLRVTIGFLQPNVGSWSATCDYLYNRGGGSNVDLTAIQAPTGVGQAAGNLTLVINTTAVAGEMQVQVVSTYAAGGPAQVALDVDGILSSLKVGA